MAERIPERVFVSYSRKDQEWLERLRVQLAPLIQSGVVQLWYDRGEIEPGDAFNRSIAEAIDSCSAAVLLVSADFQASEFIQANELPRLLRQADAGELRLFWVPVGHCVLADKLGTTYHTVGSPSRPLEGCDRAEVNRVLADLTRKLEQHVLEVRQRAEAARQAAARAEGERRAHEEAEHRPCEARKAKASTEEKKIQVSVPGRKKKVPRWLASGLGLALAGVTLVATPWDGNWAPFVWPYEEPAVRVEPLLTNSLGMSFVRVPGTDILISVWETRVRDYAAFAAENSGVDMSWKDFAFEGHSQGADHPVVNVSWEDAQAFCAWLSKKEGKTCRLPSDHEWSLAVGIGVREDPNAAPKNKEMKIPGVYPWGTRWPPPRGAGNYSGQESAGSWTKIGGYQDDHAFTAPVGSCNPNRLGIFDLGGNVWEWCEESYDGKPGSRVLRGASWGLYGPDYLLSSYRGSVTATGRYDGVGFRIVLVGSGER